MLHCANANRGESSSTDGSIIGVLTTNMATCCYSLISSATAATPRLRLIVIMPCCTKYNKYEGCVQFTSL